MNQIGKPIPIILVVGTMIAYLIIDQQANTAVETEKRVQEAPKIDLPVGAAVGELMPDFEGVTLDGESLHLSDLRGKIVLLNAFASWCGPCRLETPHLVAAYGNLDPEQVAFVGLNQAESPEAVARFQEEFGVNFPLVLYENGELTEGFYRPVGLPTSWIIDAQGVVRYVHSGPMTREVLLDLLNDVQVDREPNPFGSTGQGSTYRNSQVEKFG